MRQAFFIKSLVAAICLTISASAFAGLPEYDAAIAADNAGGLPYTAILSESVSLDGTNSAPFDFGAVSGSSTVEFIVSGDPDGGGRNGYFGAGANTTFSLRYEQWDDTGQIGFTHGGVADYVFDPAVPSPVEPAHVAYRWDGGSETMELYLNGELSGTLNAPGFEMPSGEGLLGNTAGGNEGLLGTIDRVTVYDSAIDASKIGSHAAAWIPEPSSMMLASLATGAMAVLLRRRRSV